jgi:tetratricopeptide (TPR) repeat protein
MMQPSKNRLFFAKLIMMMLFGFRRSTCVNAFANHQRPRQAHLLRHYASSSSSSSSSIVPNEDGKQWLSDAEVALKKEQYSEALSLFRRVIGANARSVQGLFGCGYSCQHLGHYDDAIEYYRQSVRMAKKESRKMRKKTSEKNEHENDVVGDDGELDASVLAQFVERAANAFATDRRKTRGGGDDDDKKKKKKKKKSSKEALDQVDDPLKRSFVAAECGIGECLALTGRTDDALTQFGRVIEMDDHYVPAYGGRGDCRLSMAAISESPSRQLKLALQDYETVLKIRPDYADALYGIGAAHLGIGDVDSARSQFEQTLVVDANHARALAGLAAVMQESGDATAAVELLDRAVANLGPAVRDEHDGGRIGVLCQRSSALLAAKRFEDALADADAVLASSDEVDLAHLIRGQSLKQLGRLADAVRSFSVFVERNADEKVRVQNGVEPEQIANIMLLRADARLAAAAASADIDASRLDGECDAHKSHSSINEFVVSLYATLKQHQEQEQQEHNIAELDTLIQEVGKALNIDDSSAMRDSAIHLLNKAYSFLHRQLKD